MTDAMFRLDSCCTRRGGIVLAALQIAQAVRGHSSTVTVFVPHLRHVGRHLIALAADEIVIAKQSVLGDRPAGWGIPCRPP